ncbi:MAG: 2OG-Fe(II) oxygenase [Sphingorhabdus sp.]|jgi:prolyl 4-hydroxylase|uniref:prolyl hydroxylase family protein n=1 Tax=Sphingorhabdus sp. TaxID=1902408 RepID=UPI00273F82CF|nr:2OG-Fe(II) oxygenase [Sphingorhabdus sp.]MCX7267359.1 2OG-Fe(II) oxygenase [Sphingomonadales bacterium]MDP4758239.1 2OG-Fe(II) oxygenase [Sphingorhabdus sp.]MDP4872407.1 2OG-Fe(II) oxygenase [Sphingorhabdus sp.]MDP4926668.1 2OG-Fe(II) oxygenase [Sphingorhabdus sp.]
MQADTTAPEFDPNNDPAKLARIGTLVASRLHANPLVQQVDHAEAQLYLYQGFLSAADCNTMIAKIDADAVPSTLYKGTEQEGFRTSYSCHLNRWDAFISKVEARMSDVLGIDNTYAETMQGQRYQVGQEFKAHHDFFHPTQDYWAHEGRSGGQRSWTAMIFLNEPEEGGTTEFPHLGLGVRPQAGMMLIWNNVKPDGTLNYKTLHTGTPVVRGVKHVITKWYRQNNWLEINTPKPS